MADKPFGWYNHGHRSGDGNLNPYFTRDKAWVEAHPDYDWEPLFASPIQASGEGRKEALEEVVAIVQEMKRSHTGYWADYLLGRLGILLAAAPKVTE